MPYDVEDNDLGVAKVKAIFQGGTIAGCEAIKGHFEKEARFRVKRNGRYIHDGECLTLQRSAKQVERVDQVRSFPILMLQYGLWLTDTLILPFNEICADVLRTQLR